MLIRYNAKSFNATHPATFASSDNRPIAFPASKGTFTTRLQTTRAHSAPLAALLANQRFSAPNASPTTSTTTGTANFVRWALTSPNSAKSVLTVPLTVSPATQITASAARNSFRSTLKANGFSALTLVETDCRWRTSAISSPLPCQMGALMNAG